MEVIYIYNILLVSYLIKTHNIFLNKILFILATFTQMFLHEVQ